MFDKIVWLQGLTRSGEAVIKAKFICWLSWVRVASVSSELGPPG